jgi:hypothetical protein
MANASARVIAENDGLVDQVSIVSAQLYNSTGNNFSTTSSLPIEFPRGAVVTLQFVNASISNCSAFSQVVVSTQCNSYANTDFLLLAELFLNKKKYLRYFSFSKGTRLSKT